MPTDIDYEENRPGGVASHECWASTAKASAFYRSTKGALGWNPSPSGEAGRAVLALVDLEELMEGATAADDYATWTAAAG